MLAAPLPEDLVVPLHNRMALICGTSTCHMALSPDERFVKGVWGPYDSAMVPGYFLLEGGKRWFTFRLSFLTLCFLFQRKY